MKIYNLMSNNQYNLIMANNNMSNNNNVIIMSNTINDNILCLQYFNINVMSNGQ